MQSESFTSPTPMSWATLNEQPFMDSYAGGRWACGANTAWGVMESGDSLTDRKCAACPPCVADRFQTRTMIRDAGPPCCTTETYGYDVGKWPYAFAAGSTCPKGSDVPLFQDLYEVPQYSKEDIPLTVPFNPFVL